jgi:hypothetical protein
LIETIDKKSDEDSVGDIQGDFYATLTIKGSIGGSLIWTSNPGEKIVIEQGVEDRDDFDENNK